MQWTYVKNYFNREKLVRRFYEKKLKKRNEKRFRIEKVVQRKSNYSYFTWKVHNNWFTD